MIPLRPISTAPRRPISTALLRLISTTPLRLISTTPLRVIPTALLCLFATLPAVAQTVLTVRPSPGSGLWIDGTSNQSDWTVEAKEFSGRVTIANGAVLAAEITVPAGKLESGRSRIMDMLMHRALNTGAHDSIAFRLVGPAVMVPESDSVRISVRGTLSLAGVEREVEFPVAGREQDDGSWRFAGRTGLLMTDYGIKPPTAMFGALHTGDAVTVRFEVIAGR